MSEQLLQPISEQYAVGEDCRYHDKYLLIEAEFAKAESINDEKPDWRLLIGTCEEFLTVLSKDLKVLSWWLCSIYHENNFSSFLNALTTYNDFLEKFGDEVFPKSLNQKVKILQWVESIFEKEFIKNHTLNIQKNYVEKLNSEIKKLQRVNESLNKNKDIKLFKNLEILLLSEITLKKKDQERKSNHSSSNTDDTIEDDSQALKTFNEIKRKSLRLHKYWSSTDPFDIKSMRILRMTVWLEIDEEPVNDNGKTKINPPGFERIEKADELIKSGEHTAALGLLEEMLVRMPFWLEGHCKVYYLLKAADRNAAAQEVKSLLNWFLQNKPWLHKLSFSDGTKMVTKDVKEMISSDAIDDEDTNTQEALFESIKQKAYLLVKKNKIGEAMELLHEAYMQSKDESERFFLRLFHAKIAIDSGKSAMALSFINELQEKIATHDLDSWQPTLAAQVYLMMLTSFNKNFIEREKLNEIYQKLCLIAPAEAVKIKL